jgi:hypothetical protein
MGRLISLLLGGAALALYGPHLFLNAETLAKYTTWWRDLLTDEWYMKVFGLGPGIFAGLALVLLAVRGRE